MDGTTTWTAAPTQPGLPARPPHAERTDHRRECSGECCLCIPPDIESRQWLLDWLPVGRFDAHERPSTELLQTATPLRDGLLQNEVTADIEAPRLADALSRLSPLVWNGVLPPQLFGGAPIRWDFEPGLNAFTSTAGGKPTTHYVKRGSWNAATVSSPQPTLSGGFDIEEGHEDPALRHGQKWARIWCPLGGDPHLGNPQYRGKGVAYHEPVGLCCFTKLPYKEMPDCREILGHCLFWIFFIGVQAIPLYYIYENIPPSLSPATRAVFAVHSLFMEVLSIWVSIPVLLLWCLIIRGCCDRTNAGILPCSMHRVTPYFARKYPHLVTRGPAAQR